MVPIAHVLRETGDKLAAAGIDNARREARLLLAHALDLQPAQLLDSQYTATAPERLEALVARRVAREPLALIIGRWEFWGLDVAVSAATLVPRADSETLIEAALAAFPARGEPRSILDLGTGTGCLLLAALHEFPSAFGVGVDRVPAATDLARRNAATLGLTDRAAFLCADWGSALIGRFDLVLCNPPYVRAADIATLMPEVALHEPISALLGGQDGLDAYRAVMPGLPALMAPGGAAILEIGCGQARLVEQLAVAAGFATSLRADLAGINRALTIRMPP